MSAGQLAHPTGDRVTAKVRQLAAESGLGGVRHVSAATLNGPGWTTVVLALLVFSLGPVLVGGASPATAAGVGAACVVIFAGILVFLASEKLVVLERGILVGSFAPFLRPTALPFAAIDARTVRAVVANQRTLGLLLADRGVNGGSRTVLWSRRAVTFIGVAPVLAKRAAVTREPLDLATATGVELWVFSARNPSSQESLVRALGTAMRSAGAPGADDVEALALPAQPVEVSADGADRLAIPERFRAPRVRRTR
ncbi:hypothetical protein [Cellulosimicrobium cellulans]|uniref:hypothetical protein n=1 Tax=Cellulosimicrobium cellulans TaxID=1710 RepID=UPI0008485AE6|nr:hypothetical protein [Cellulosimicrobium cellulans]